jgi:DNA-binding response OmpR family regulator
MPLLSGLDLVRRLRRGGTATPVLMLTARDAPADRITGWTPTPMTTWSSRSTPQRGRCWSPGTVSLTATELGILEILMRRSPGVADRRSIAQRVWDNEADAFGSNTIDVHLARLRSKLAGTGVRIETVHGVGYRIIAS